MAEVIYADDCAKYLAEAEMFLSQIVPLTPYQEIFVEEAQEQAEANQKAGQGAMNAIGNAFKALIDMIKKLIAKIGTALRGGLTKDEEAAYKQFKEACKRDPSLANKKVTATDWKKLRADYESFMKKSEMAEREAAAGRTTAVEDLKSDAEAFIKNLGTGYLTTTTADIAIKASYANKAFARTLYNQLLSDERVLEQMNKQYGEEGTKYITKEIASAAGARGALGWLHRMKYRAVNKAFLRQNQDLKSIIASSIKSQAVSTAGGIVNGLGLDSNIIDKQRENKIREGIKKMRQQGKSEAEINKWVKRHSGKAAEMKDSLFKKGIRSGANFAGSTTSSLGGLAASVGANIASKKAGLGDQNRLDLATTNKLMGFTGAKSSIDNTGNVIGNIANSMKKKPSWSQRRAQKRAEKRAQKGLPNDNAELKSFITGR